MDLLPHQIIHLLSLGQEDRVLGCKTLWMCAGCYTCAVRCPNDINITAVMDEMRAKAIKQGKACPRPEVLAFHKNFIDNFKRRGRVHELSMMGKYNLLRGEPFKDAALGPKMFLKGKLRLLPPKKVRGFSRWMKKLWQK